MGLCAWFLRERGWVGRDVNKTDYVTKANQEGVPVADPDGLTPLHTLASWMGVHEVMTCWPTDPTPSLYESLKLSVHLALAWGSPVPCLGFYGSLPFGIPLERVPASGRVGAGVPSPTLRQPGEVGAPCTPVPNLPGPDCGGLGTSSGGRAVEEPSDGCRLPGANSPAGPPAPVAAPCPEAPGGGAPPTGTHGDSGATILLGGRSGRGLLGLH